MNKYKRQIAVSEFGLAGQKKLMAARILVVGAGGLASPVLQYLVGAGLGQIRLVDPDIVVASNLHRQTLFRINDLGFSKAKAAANHMAELNPDCKIKAINQLLTPDNVETLIADVDLVIDCADSFAVSYILSDHCQQGGLALVQASVVGMSGYVGGFCADAPGLRAVFPDLPKRFGSCDQDGVLGPVVGVIGALQAQFAVAIINGKSPSPLGQMVTYDASVNRFSGFRFDDAIEPEQYFRFISPSQIHQDDFVIDLRDQSEAPLATPNAIRVELDKITAELPLALAKRVVLCCQAGQRAWAAAEKLSDFWVGPVVLIAAGASITFKKED